MLEKIIITDMKADEMHELESLKIINERRAVRRYKDQTVEKDLINKILDAGRMAPSAMNKQPWKFYILTNKENIKIFSKEIAKIIAKELAKTGPLGILKLAVGAISTLHIGDLLKGHDPIFYGAPVVIFITAPRDNEWAPLDIGMCSQNIMLAAKSLGLDSCPLGMGKYVELTKLYSRLHIPLSEQVHLAIIMGYGDETPEAHKRVKDNATYID